LVLMCGGLSKAGLIELNVLLGMCVD